MPGHVFQGGKWVPYEERLEALGERLSVDPFSDEEPLECDVDEVETCDACN